MKPFSTLSFLIALSIASPSMAAWQRLPSVSKRPVEMAVASMNGTKIASSSGIGQVQSLISDNPIDSSTISAGNAEAVIDAGRQTLFEVATFTNDDTEGKVSISASADNSNWIAVGQAVYSAADRSVSVNFAGIQAKFVKVQWELSKGGTIRNFQLFGGETDNDFAMSQNASGTGGETLNMAAGMGGARIIYAHPNPSGSTEKGVNYNSFEFPESDEKYRTVIYDLGTVRIMNQFGSVHSPRPVRFEVYAFNDLPEKADWRGQKSFDPTAFDTMTPVAKAEDARGVGYIRVKPDHAVKARYVALRWEPDYNPPGFSVGGTTIGGSGFGKGDFKPGSGAGGGGGAGGGAGAGGGDGSGNGGGSGEGQSGGSMPGGAPGGLISFAGSTGGFGGGGGLPATFPGNANNNGGNGPQVVINPPPFRSGGN